MKFLLGIRDIFLMEHICMQTALDLITADPAAGTFVVIYTNGNRAWGAAYASISLFIKRMFRQVIFSIYCFTSAFVQFKSGFTFNNPSSCNSKNFAFARTEVWSRRKPLIHAFTSLNAFCMGCTFRKYQHKFWSFSGRVRAFCRGNTSPPVLPKRAVRMRRCSDGQLSP